MLGIPDGTFGQELNITRGQAARLYHRGAVSPDASVFRAHGFGDVTPFYDDAVRWATARGLANEFPDGTFRHTADIKRGNAARTFYNTARTPASWNDPTTAPPNMVFRPNLPT